MNKNYAIFICADGPYLPFVNVLLNSFDRYNMSIPVYLIHYNFPAIYIKKAQQFFDFEIIPIAVKKEDFNIHEINKDNHNLFIKQARFKYIREYGLKYDVCCMLDVDMFISSSKFVDLFDDVCGKKSMIGCRNLATVNNPPFHRNYVHNEKPLFSEEVYPTQFHCSVPIIFDMRHWIDVFDTYNDLAYQTFEKRGDKLGFVRDFMCWNMSVRLHNKQGYMSLYPTETMTQLKGSCAYPWTRIFKDNGIWRSVSGHDVYSIHGKIGTTWWANSIGKLVAERLYYYGLPFTEEIQKQMEKTVRSLQKEWYDLNIDGKLSIYDFYSKNEYWESFK